MVKRTKKASKTQTNTINSISPDNKPQPKSRQQIYQENYQKNKERKKQQQKERYQQDKERIKAQKKINYAKKKAQEQLSTKQIQAKYYQAKHIEVLMPFKEYTELNKKKMKLWIDFNQTLKDINKGITGIVDIMKLEQVTNNLIRDFWETAKSEKRKLSKSWNSLDYDQQQRVIKYWGYEKVRIENGYLDEEERLERQSNNYLKEIERAKFHEERGKINCDCWDCETKKEIQAEIKAEREKIIADYEKEQKADKEQCPECQKWVKELDEEAGVCKGCKKKYE